VLAIRKTIRYRQFRLCHIYAWRPEQWQKNLEASDLFDSDLQTGVTVRQFEVWNINLT
jgi:hypothetical protein